MSDEGKTERSLVGRLTAMLEAERAAHERAERERDEARARVAQLEEAIRAADGSHLHAADCSSAEPFYEPPAPACDCNRNEAKAALVEAALSTSPSDWLAEHDRSIAERQREACAKAAALAPSCEIHEHGPCEWDGACDAIAELVRATPLVTK